MVVRRKKSIAKYVIIVSSIIVINLTGVSYAYWTDDVSINTILTTGDINPRFCEDTWIRVVRDDQTNSKDSEEESTLSNLWVDFEDEHTMVINGELEYGYKAFVHYCVINNGTIPVKYDQSESKKAQHEELKMNDGLKVNITQESKTLEPGDKLYTPEFENNSNPKIDIQVPNKPKVQRNLGNKQESEGDPEPEPDIRSFELNLPFIQDTKPNNNK